MRCPLSYQPLEDERGRYSRQGLKRLSPKLRSLEPLPFSNEELRFEATARSGKMSIGGVQPKVSAVLKVSAGRFELVNSGGRYILKPDSPHYPEVPANEDVTMRMAQAAGLEVPVHGLIWTREQELCYVIRRFDRIARNRKVPTEDFGQLLGLRRDTKYESSIERVIGVVNDYCTFPLLEKTHLYRMILVAFLTGNEDLHIKNFSLITDASNTIKLSPVYDMLNSTIVLREPTEEMALTMAGKKSRFKREHFVTNLARERLGLNAKSADLVLSEVVDAQAEWDRLLDACFLSEEKKESYREVLSERRARLELPGC
ncbi:MAG: HipA domain-containing protein [Rhodothermales bacterium]|nr:HipA domain-containing protein [Rhodothermales bacterium]MBO6781486.1 HipA domain-containing protein [Rhodothermales bacterium]